MILFFLLFDRFGWLVDFFRSFVHLFVVCSRLWGEGRGRDYHVQLCLLFLSSLFGVVCLEVEVNTLTGEKTTGSHPIHTPIDFYSGVFNHPPHPSLWQPGGGAVKTTSRQSA